MPSIKPRSVPQAWTNLQLYLPAWAPLLSHVWTQPSLCGAGPGQIAGVPNAAYTAVGRPISYGPQGEGAAAAAGPRGLQSFAQIRPVGPMMSSQAYLQQANAQLQSLHGAALFFFITSQGPHPVHGKAPHHQIACELTTSRSVCAVQADPAIFMSWLDTFVSCVYCCSCQRSTSQTPKLSDTRR